MKVEETLRGPVWQIPESDLDKFEYPKMGRPAKPPAETEAEAKPKRKRAA